MLRQIEGLELREIAEGELCCGSAGIYNLLEPETAGELGERKARNVLASGADLVATANPGCLLQVRASLQRLGHTLPLAHPIELLDASQRGLPVEEIVAGGQPVASNSMEVLQPTTLREALDAKAAHPEAVPIAGGTDVLVELNFDRRRPVTLLDLTRVEELTQHERTDGHVRLGAGVTYTRIIRELVGRPAGPGDRGPHGRLAADPQPRHGRRQPRLGVAGRRRPPAAPGLRRRDRAGLGPRHPPRPGRPLLHRGQAERAGRGRAGDAPSTCRWPAARSSSARSARATRWSSRSARWRWPSTARPAPSAPGSARPPRRPCGRPTPRPSWPACWPRAGRRARPPRGASASSSPPRRARSTTSAAAPPTAVTRWRCWPRRALALVLGGRRVRIALHRQRRAARGRRRLAGREPAVRPARAARPARLEERLRAGRVRLLLGVPRRHPGLLLPGAGGPGRGPGGDHRRGPGRRATSCTRSRRPSSRPARCSAASAPRG